MALVDVFIAEHLAHHRAVLGLGQAVVVAAPWAAGASGYARASQQEVPLTNFIEYAQDGPVVTLTMNELPRRNPQTPGNAPSPTWLAAIERSHADGRARSSFPGARRVVMSAEGRAK